MRAVVFLAVPLGISLLAAWVAVLAAGEPDERDATPETWSPRPDTLCGVIGCPNEWTETTHGWRTCSNHAPMSVR